MHAPDKIRFEVELDAQAANAFAQFLKRAGYRDYRELATSEQEAYQMQHAGEAVRTVLAASGISPR